MMMMMTYLIINFIIIIIIETFVVGEFLLLFNLCVGVFCDFFFL